MPAPHRSIIPSVPGVPAGAAVLIAVLCTSIGFFIDASGQGKELTHVFAAFYIIGCAIAALVVRYRGLFTTMVTPPLLLFLAVPVAYQQLLGHSSTSLKDILLNLAIPLVNRFPAMAIGTVVVLAIGLVRLLLQRRLEESPAPRARGGRARKGDSWGPRPGADRSRRADSADTPRKRTRTGATPAVDTPAKATRAGRKTTGRVAERPPQVSGSRTAERSAVNGASARQRADADVPVRKRPDADPLARKRAAADTSARHRAEADARPRQRPTTDPHQRTAEPRGPGPADPSARQRAAGDPQPRRSAAADPRQRPASADPVPRRSRADYNNDVPPHPRPNVRYREHDAGRIEH